MLNKATKIKYLIPMKTKIYIALIVFLTLNNACKKDVYVNFTDEEQALFVYEEGDQFSFLRESRSDSVVFDVTSKVFSYSEIHFPFNMRVRDYFAQVCTINFEGAAYKGEIIFGKFEIEGLSSSIEILEGDKVVFSGGAGWEADSIFSKEEFYYLGEDTLIYSKEKGIVYFTTSFPEEVFTLIE